MAEFDLPEPSGGELESLMKSMGGKMGQSGIPTELTGLPKTYSWDFPEQPGIYKPTQTGGEKYIPQSYQAPKTFTLGLQALPFVLPFIKALLTGENPFQQQIDLAAKMRQAELQRQIGLQPKTFWDTYRRGI